MKEKLEALLREGSEKIQNAKNEAELQQIKGAYLGKQGSVTELMKEMPKLDPALRPEMGKAVTMLKTF
jgi:phenylalanyl-tRNA synthetase alpha chain